MNFGRIQQSVLYQSDAQNNGWQRLGFDVSSICGADINMDILDRNIVSGNTPDVVIIATNNPDRIGVMRRLKYWVRMMVLISPHTATEPLKRNANVYVPLEHIIEPDVTVDASEVYRAVIKFIATTSIPYVGLSYLTRTALPIQMKVCNSDDARKFVSEAEQEGILYFYDHQDDEGNVVKAVKLNPEHDLVGVMMEQMLDPEEDG
jgi:hypothetical protein